jgi:hypothetical protein
MGYARVAIAPDLLIAALHLPADTRIVGADMDHSHGHVVLAVAHPDLKELHIKEGEQLPITTPIFRTDTPGLCVSWVSWGQD